MQQLTILCNPVFYILIVNIIGLIWAVRSWKKNIREKWMNSLRDAEAELIGAAELVYGLPANNNEELPKAKADFIAKEQKLLLLFAHNTTEKRSFKTESEALRIAAEEKNIEKYRSQLDTFSKAISERVLQEWNDIK
ncbi:MAG: hypothetical protein HRU78_06915 [Gammaproteobacteria bacterium]|nr:MAG: hypothetical protein HRU78_06915 [Gammaproteobacteria bacterium]